MTKDAKLREQIKLLTTALSFTQDLLSDLQMYPKESSYPDSPCLKREDYNELREVFKRNEKALAAATPQPETRPALDEIRDPNSPMFQRKAQPEAKVTYRDVLSRLDEPYRSQALANTPASMLAITPTISALSDCLCGAFIWRDSPEGHEYWSELAKRFEQPTPPATESASKGRTE